MSHKHSVIRDSVYAKTRRRLVNDQVVQRMAADIRIGGLPRAKFAHDSGGPTHEFMGNANAAYDMLGGKHEGPLHLGGIAEAVLQLAYDLPTTTYTVQFASEPMSELGEWIVKTVTKVELGQRIRNLVCASHDLEIPDVAVHLTGPAGLAKHAHTGEEIVSFTITEETGQQA